VDSQRPQRTLRQRSQRRSSRPRPTQRWAWVSTVANDLDLGDTLPQGVIRGKSWGGSVGIYAWRFDVGDGTRPVWLKRQHVVLCRRGERAAVTPALGGVHPPLGRGVSRGRWRSRLFG
jgi:hypothetical protein